MGKYASVRKINDTTYVERRIASPVIPSQDIAMLTSIDNDTNLDFLKKNDAVIAFFLQKKADLDSYFISLCEIAKFKIEEFDDTTLAQVKKDVLFKINSIIEYLSDRNSFYYRAPDSFESFYKKFILNTVIRQVFFRYLVHEKIHLSKGAFSILQNEDIVLRGEKEYIELVDRDDSFYYVNIDNCIIDDFGNIFIPDSAKEKGKYAQRFQKKVYAGG